MQPLAACLPGVRSNRLCRQPSARPSALACSLCLRSCAERLLPAFVLAPWPRGGVVRLQAQLSQIRALEAVSKETESKRTTYEDVTLQVKKLWDTLCDDIGLLHSHAARELVRCSLVLSASLAAAALGTLICKPAGCVRWWPCAEQNFTVLWPSRVDVLAACSCSSLCLFRERLPRMTSPPRRSRVCWASSRASWCRSKPLQPAVRSARCRQRHMHRVGTTSVCPLADLGLVDTSDSLRVAQDDSAELQMPVSEVNGVSCSDPFLAALVGHKQSLAERVFKADLLLREDYSAIEQQLHAKADDTSRVFQELLACVQVRA